MRLATYVDPSLSFDARFGIISGDHIVDVVAVADALHRAVPAISVKTALTSGAQTLIGPEGPGGGGRKGKAAAADLGREIPAADP